MDNNLSQKEKIAAAKKKLRKFQQKAARLDRKLSNGSGSHDNDAESQQSDTIHQQTIDILVEEKAELLKARDKQKSLCQQQQDDISVLKSQLYSANSELSSSVKKRSSLQNQYNSRTINYEDKVKENEMLSKQVLKLNEQLTVIQTELSVLTSERNELNERLSKSASASPLPQVHNEMSAVPNPFKRNSDVIRLEDDVMRLTQELESTSGALASRDMQYDTLAGRSAHQSMKFNEHIQELETTIQLRDSDISCLLKQLEAVTADKTPSPTPVVQDIERSSPQPAASTPLIQQQSGAEELHQRDVTIQQLHDDKKKLQHGLEEQILAGMKLQKQLDNFQETHVDQNTLLVQINNDKATISRAMGQNKQLKEHMIDLQDKLMRTSETNVSLANEVQQLSAHVNEIQSALTEQTEKEELMRQQLSEKDMLLRQRALSEDTILGGSCNKQELQSKIKELSEKIGTLQQEKAILGLSAAQVDSVKAMNVALQEKVTSLSQQLNTGVSPRQIQLEQQIERLEKQYNSAAVDNRIQTMQTNERLEREKQREFLDKYYEERLREQIEGLEERIAVQSRQFKQYVIEIQVTNDDEVEVLRTQLSELQRNFRTSLQTQYTQLVQYFKHKEATDLKAREEELHSHYMKELSRLYSEMTHQLQQETDAIRTRNRTQSDDISIFTVEEAVGDTDWEEEKITLQSTIEQLEDEIVNIETGVSGDETDSTEEEIKAPEQTKAERQLKAHINVLEMQLARAQDNTDIQRYKQEVQRQSYVIQKLHTYLAQQTYDNTQDNGDDNISLTSAGQFYQPSDMSSTRSDVEEEHTDNVPTVNQNIVYTTQENELEARLKYLVGKVPEGGEYVIHMEKLQEKFAIIMKDNANLHEKLKDVEHQNVLLEGETDTIGEYISLYQSQRKALRLQFQQKDNFINQLLNERSEMQAHTSRLQQLISELPCVEDTTNTTLTRDRSNSITSNVSTLSIMSTTRDEMLEIIGKLKLRNPSPTVGGPMYAGGRGPIRDI